MTGEHLEAILKVAGAKADKDGWATLPEGGTMTLHVAHDGASMTVSRIEAVKHDGELVFARNPKRELFAVVAERHLRRRARRRVRAGKVARRAGFG